MKGYTSWAVGLSVSSICSSIIRNMRNIVALSVNIKVVRFISFCRSHLGFYYISQLQDIHGVANDVYLSLPSVIGENGVTDIVKQNLNEKELKRLQKSAEMLQDVQKNLLI